ncbi:MAG: DUF4430 domain-containing protein [Erysipelotrichaceae bacterium]|nr:DUF4430 domain-containing protein [Erysipelotrichaceae bacterium]MDD3809024.1 DUF4430 domain-containing protein [Erysipelotrichaceae bacterium]
MKKIFALLFTFVLSFSLVGCASKTADANQKTITLEVVSERDSVNDSTEYQTTEATLADFLKAEDMVVYEDSEYGMYIHEVNGIKDDEANQYWWGLSVDGEMAPTGADGIELADGSTYNLTLNQGY